MGRTECNRIVNFDGGPNFKRLVGQMLDVSITQALPHSLRATPVLEDLVPVSAPGAGPDQSPATTG
jgi:tRNA-2-methylthio-N6-dimethylallyladenosine synthase